MIPVLTLLLITLIVNALGVNLPPCLNCGQIHQCDLPTKPEQDQHWHESYHCPYPLKPKLSKAEQRYLADYPDVAKSKDYKDNPRAHYDKYGKDEGRHWHTHEDDGDIDNCEAVKTQYVRDYRNQLEKKDRHDPRHHYEKHGKKRGLNWHSHLCTKDIQKCDAVTNRYLLQNPDVAKAKMDPVYHWTKHGNSEDGREWPTYFCASTFAPNTFLWNLMQTKETALAKELLLNDGWALTSEEAAAVLLWTRDGPNAYYRTLNGLYKLSVPHAPPITSLTHNKELITLGKRLDSAISKQRKTGFCDTENTLWRGVSASTKPLKSYEVQKTVRLMGYSAASPNKNVAVRFSGSGVILKFLPTKNYALAPMKIGKYSNFDNEDEVLFPRESNFVITAKYIETFGTTEKTILELQPILESQKFLPTYYAVDVGAPQCCSDIV